MNYNVVLEHTKDNKVIPLINGFTIHSKYSPQTEGQKISDLVLEKHLDKSTPLMVLGIGFAYHFLDLIDKFTTIYIAESITELITEARKQDFLKPVFEKCQIISNLNEAPYLENFELITLRSEVRFQEKFFNDLLQRVKIKKSDYTLKPEELRIMVDYPIYGGSYTTAEYVKKAFEKANCQVKIMDNAIANPMLQYMLNIEKYKDTVINKLNELLTDLLWEQFLEFRPHILFCLAQAPISPQVIKAIRQSGTIVIFWFVEDYRRFPYWDEVIQYVDYFFRIQNAEFTDKIKIYPNTISEYIPMACQPDIHKALATSEIPDIYKSDISFMGAAFNNRVNFFRELSHYNLKLWGTGWEIYDELSSNCMLEGKRIDIEESVKIFNGTKININLHSSMEDTIFDQYGDFINPRTFEICACGGFQLVDDRLCLREIFTPDYNIVTFSSLEEAKDKIDYYLSHDNERELIAKRGQQLVLEKHTYQMRIEQMLKIVQENSPVLRDRVEKEQQKIHDLLRMINNKDFQELIDKIPPALRQSSTLIINQIKKSSSSLKDYEAIILLLESFMNGE